MKNRESGVQGHPGLHETLSQKNKHTKLSPLSNEVCEIWDREERSGRQRSRKAEGKGSEREEGWRKQEKKQGKEGKRGQGDEESREERVVRD